MTRSQFRSRALNNPRWFAKHVLGVDLWDKQVEIIRAVLNDKRTETAGCVGSSKTFAAAVAVHEFLFAYGPEAEVYTTAPTFRQVKKFLWKEIRKLYNGAVVDLGPRPLDTEWKIKDGWYALGFSPKDPDSVHGAHAKNILVIIDEAQGVDQEIIEASENALAGGNAHMAIFYNPNTTTGEAYECTHSRAELYTHIRIPADETPNWIQNKTVIPGMIERAQAEEWIKTFGWESNFVRVKVRCLYPRQDADALIPIEWIELAMNREARDTGDSVVGVDVAREGDDDVVIAPMRGRTVHELKVRHGQDLMATTGDVKITVEEYGAIKTCVDVIGMGGGPVDRLKELKVPGVEGVNVHKKAHNVQRFADLDSEIGWGLREALDPSSDEPIALPKDLELQAQLSSIGYGQDSQGRIKVKSKDETKKKLKGRSPDKADAVKLAHYASFRGKPIASGTVNPRASPGAAGTRMGDRQTIMNEKRSGAMRRLRERFGA